MDPRIAVVGAGWSGVVVARVLADSGYRVELIEKSPVIGGHARFETVNGVFYEPNGPHIFHTSNPKVANFVMRFGLNRPYRHMVLTEVFLSEDDEEPRLLSWPPQVSELEDLPIWPSIRSELEMLPQHPAGEDFETYVTSMMGPTLFDLLIRGYTLKQWGRDPSQLSSRLAPKRVELRRDGYRRLFRDKWEFFPATGYNTIIEAIAADIPLTSGWGVDYRDLDTIGDEFDAMVMTGPLDDFLGKPGMLEWRGISSVARFNPDVGKAETFTPAYVVNRPSLRVPHTRTVETKHATGQRIAGTVVCEEYPGSLERHYPVHTVEETWERRNKELQIEIQEMSPIPLFFTGRLANYQYINQDQAIEQAWECATNVRQLIV